MCVGAYGNGNPLIPQPVSTVFFFDLDIVVEVVKFPVLKAVFVLFGFCCSEDCRQRIAEVYGTDFLPFCRPYLGFMPCSVVANTAAYRKILLVKVDVLPSQAADLTNTKPRVVSNLNGQQYGI